MARQDDFVKPCWFRDRYGYKHKRLHWAWHEQWWMAFAVRKRSRRIMKLIHQSCFVTRADVEWAQKFTKEHGLM